MPTVIHIQINIKTIHTTTILLTIKASLTRVKKMEFLQEWTTLKSLNKFENKSNADSDNNNKDSDNNNKDVDFSNKDIDFSKHLRENSGKENTELSNKSEPECNIEGKRNGKISRG